MSDDADKATADEERAWDVWQRQRERSRAASVAALLKRVALHCLGCGGEIPHARLVAVPTATRCVACEGKREQQWSR